MKIKGGGPTPIVNDLHFSDAHAIPNNAPPTPGLGSPMDTFNPGAGSEALPNGPPKYIQPQGKKVMAKGLTNKRLTGTI
jgi:hypothetical protein